MDFNLVVLGGRLTVAPEVREFDSGTRLARYLLAVRSEEPQRRMDVVPVTLWEPLPADLERVTGDHLWVTGMVQRRFWTASEGRRSRLEVVATSVTCRNDSSLS